MTILKLGAPYLGIVNQVLAQRDVFKFIVVFIRPKTPTHTYSYIVKSLPGAVNTSSAVWYAKIRGVDEILFAPTHAIVNRTKE